MPISLTPRESPRVYYHTLSDEFLDELKTAVEMIQQGNDQYGERKIEAAISQGFPNDTQMGKFVFQNYGEVFEILDMGEDAIHIVRDIKGRMELLEGRKRRYWSPSRGCWSRDTEKIRHSLRVNE